MSNNTISIVWWNTSLAPSTKSRATNRDLNLVCGMINLLINVLEKDFIVLGEVSDLDVDYIQSNCQLPGYEFVINTSQVGRSQFDTCIIYNVAKISILNNFNITSTKGNSVLRIAQKLDVLVELSNSIIHIFISHWPSRLWCAENHADRHFLGIRLRDEIDNVIKKCDSNPYIVLLGDYNDEPFNKSLSEQVMATRDKNLVSKRKHLLYNPFWKHMYSSSNDIYSCGSYFYKSGKTTQWHTFDQLMFSHAFIEAKEWRLNESSENILYVPEYLQAVTDTNEIFDHLPVGSEIERVV